MITEVTNLEKEELYIKIKDGVYIRTVHYSSDGMEITENYLDDCPDLFLCSPKQHKLEMGVRKSGGLNKLNIYLVKEDFSLESLNSKSYAQLSIVNHIFKYIS